MAVGRITHPELTREEVLSVLVQPLQQRNVFLAAGPRMFDSDGSQIRIPKLQGSTAPGWHGENELITEADVDFGSVILLPSTLKSVKVLVPMSNEVIRQSVIALEASLRDRLVFDVSKTLDFAFFRGTGAADVNGLTTPKGMLNWDGTQKIAVNGAPTLDQLHDAVGLALNAYADPDTMRFFVTPRELTRLRQLKDAYGRYQLEPDPTAAGAWRLMGIPVSVSNHLFSGGTENPTGASAIVLADMDQVAVGRDLSPSVRILDQTRGDRDQTLIRVVTRYDVAPLNAEAVILLTGVTTPELPGVSAPVMAAGRAAASPDSEDESGEDEPKKRTVKKTASTKKSSKS